MGNVINMIGGISGLKPIIKVTAPGGTVLTCGSQTYTLGPSETEHLFNVWFGVDTLTATLDGTTLSQIVSADTATIYEIEFIFSRLPAEYQEVEYVQSSGLQYIDLSTSFPNGFRVVAEVEIVKVDSTQKQAPIVGAHASSEPYGRNMLGAVYDTSTAANQAMFVGRGSAYKSPSQSITLETKYIFEASNISNPPWLKIDGVSQTLTKTAASSDVYSNLSFYLFTWHYGTGTFALGASEKIYDIKLYTGETDNTLAMELVPCYRKLDGVVGMYDIVNDQFYVNSGTGYFLRGNAVNCLPAGYDQVDFIVSSGTQYIDTGVLPALDVSYEINFKFNPLPATNKYCLLCGSGTLGDAKASYVAYTYNGNTMIGVGTEKTTGIAPTTKDRTYLLNSSTNHLCCIDGATIAQSYATAFAPNGRSMYLLYQNNSSPLASFSPCGGNLYRATIVKNGSLIRDFVPCVRRSDNEVGMYDIVGGQFYGNIGTGSFSAGTS